MARLFKFWHDGRKAGKPAEVLEGVVQQCTLEGINYDDGIYRNSYKIQLDTFELPIVIEGGGFSLERGQKIRAHSFEGFDKTYRDGHKKKTVKINGLEILDLEGKTKFDYLARGYHDKWGFVEE